MNRELKELRRQIAESLTETGITDELLYERIDRLLTVWGRNRRLSLKEKEGFRKQLFDSFRGMDILQPLLEDDSVTEIMVNGLQGIYIERGSEISRWNRSFHEREPLDDIIQVMAASVNRIVNTSSPIADLRLADGSRVNIVLPPVAPEGPVMTIRKFFRDPLTLEKLLELKALTEDAADFLKSAVRCGCNIFISGGTGSGKTTFLNALSAFIPEEERVITIEDSLELQLQGLPNLVRLETRNANLEGENRITIRDLIRTALRMRPNRIVVGEVRGEEALDMLQAMNTGHRGSLSTGHANSAENMLSRLETMALMGGELPLAAIRSQIASALDLLVHLGRLPDRKRCVLSVSEILGMEGGEIRIADIFRHERENGLIFTGHQPLQTRKWEEVFGAVPCFDERGRFSLCAKGENGGPGPSAQKTALPAAGSQGKLPRLSDSSAGGWPAAAPGNGPGDLSRSSLL